MAVRFVLNGNPVEADDAPDTPLLWVLRDSFGLKGSKYGCGVGLCGACVMHLDGAPIRACVVPLAAADGARLTTIEGLGTPDAPHPLQRAWVARNVPQCGYCQSGQIMSAAALLAANPRPGASEVEAVMSGNLCRCGCYPRIKQAILDVAAGEFADAPSPGGGGSPTETTA